jgi:hypothetical protein
VTYRPVLLFKLGDLEDTSEGVVETALTTVHVGPHPYYAPTFPLPWSQLSVIDFPFTALTADAWCFIIAECPKLTIFDVSLKPSESPNGEHGSSWDQPIHLECLEYFSISAFSGGGEDFLNRLVAPRLSTLIVVGLEFTVPSIIQFQLRSHFVLTTFIPAVHIPAEDVEALFQHLSDIKVLGIVLISSEHFPSSFWERVGCSDLLPHLRELDMRPSVQQLPTLVDMVAARWEAEVSGFGSALTVKFHNIRPQNLEAVNDELRRLEKYAEGGRAVQLVVIA